MPTVCKPVLHIAKDHFFADHLGPIIFIKLTKGAFSLTLCKMSLRSGVGGSKKH